MNRKIRILHIINDLEAGGAEEMMYKLLRSMDGVRYLNRVVSLRSGGIYNQRIKELSIDVDCAGIASILSVPLGCARLRRLIRDAKPDIIQTWMYGANVITSLMMYILRSKIPIIWNVRCAYMDVQKYGWKARALLKVGKYLSSRAAGIVVNSKSGIEYHKAIGYRSHRWMHIPNGFLFDEERRIRISRMRTIGIVGRLDPMKDHDTFMRAIKILKDRGVVARYVCIGDGPEWYKNSLKATARSLGISDDISWLGYVDDKKRIYSSFDIYTSSSYGEGFPNALGEAMSYGLPCVVTQAGDSAEIVRDIGIVVPPKDPDALAIGWKRLLDMKEEELKDMGNRLRNIIVQDYSMKTVTAKYESLYYDIVNTPSNSTGEPKESV